MWQGGYQTGEETSDDQKKVKEYGQKGSLDGCNKLKTLT
jgi:hypothetical protein